LILSGGGLVTDFITPLAAEGKVFSASNLALTTGLVTFLIVELFKGTDGFFTEDPASIFLGALLANGDLEDPGNI